MSIHWGGRGPGHTGRKTTAVTPTPTPSPSGTGQLDFSAAANSALIALLEDI